MMFDGRNWGWVAEHLSFGFAGFRGLPLYKKIQILDTPQWDNEDGAVFKPSIMNQPEFKSQQIRIALHSEVSKVCIDQIEFWGPQKIFLGQCIIDCENPNCQVEFLTYLKKMFHHLPSVNNPQTSNLTKRKTILILLKNIFKFYYPKIKPFIVGFLTFLSQPEQNQANLSCLVLLSFDLQK